MPGLSFRFKWLSFFACVGVLVIHGRSYLRLPHPGTSILVVQYFLAEALVRFAVPTFFVISGYWWAKKWDGRVFLGYGALLKKKWGSLARPYLIWGALGAILQFALVGLDNAITHQPLLARTVFDTQGFWSICDRIFGITLAGPHGNMPLWFLRQLILCFCFVPIVDFILQIGRVLPLIIGLGLAAGGSFLPAIPHNPISLNCLGWFVLGAAICRIGLEKRRISMLTAVVSFFLWAGSSMLIMMSMMKWLIISPAIQTALMSFLAIFGMVFLWKMTECLSERLMPKCAQNLFFVYCFHQFPAAFFIAAMHFLFNKSDWETHVSFFLSPVVTLLACYATDWMFHRYFPKVRLILNGGR